MDNEYWVCDANLEIRVLCVTLAGAEELKRNHREKTFTNGYDDMDIFILSYEEIRNYKNHYAWQFEIITINFLHIIWNACENTKEKLERKTQ